MKQTRKTGVCGAVLGLLAAGALLTGCATTQPAFTEYSDSHGPGPSTVGANTPVSNTSAAPADVVYSTGDRTDIFRVGDLVNVVFSGTSELIPPHEERIKEDGTITLNYIGPIKAAGKTAGELQREIRTFYVPRIYRDSLNVTVRSQLRVYYVGGEVRSPGPREYIGETDILKAIQAAGDFTDFANKRKVQLTRNGKTQVIHAPRALTNPAENVAIYPGDRIHVPRRFF
jgi:protein involved in polysaccharide export with SLBB domain